MEKFLVSPNSIWRIHYGKRKLINCLISIKFGFQGFFGITNSPLDLQRFQRFSKKFFLKTSNFDQIWYMGTFDVVYYKFNDKSSKFKIVDRVRRTTGEKLLNFNANWYIRFFGVADYESAFILLKFRGQIQHGEIKMKIIQCCPI